MARVRFLADANLDQNIVAGVVRREPGIEFELPQRLIAEEEFDQAASVLEASMKQSPNEEIKVLLVDAKQRVDEFAKKVEGAVARARRLMDTRKFDEAVSFLEAQPKTFARKNEFTAVLERARTEQDQIKAVGAAIENLADDAVVLDSHDGKVLQRFNLAHGKWVPSLFPYTAVVLRARSSKVA